jgi:DNA mismatch endonuclease, patch repair protein
MSDPSRAAPVVRPWVPPVGSWASSEANRRVMRANRSRDTLPELLVRRAVHAMGLRYRVASRPVPDIRIRADMVFAGSRVAVFIDGCFWHGCPDHSSTPRTNPGYWTVKIAANRDRDARAARLLADAGWTVVRVWEHDDPGLSAARIRTEVAAARPRGAAPRR